MYRSKTGRSRAKPEKGTINITEIGSCLPFAALAAGNWTASQREHILTCDSCKSRLRGLAIDEETGGPPFNLTDLTYEEATEQEERPKTKTASATTGIGRYILGLIDPGGTCRAIGLRAYQYAN